jgi:predicted GNAT family acetyltransferase
VTARPTADPDVVDDASAARYELRIDGEVAGFASYRLAPGRVTIPHLVVGGAWEGRGLGSRLARAALDDVRARGMSVVPDCPFVAAWIRRHPDYADLVDGGGPVPTAG